MDAVSVAAVTATRPYQPSSGSPIPPTDLLVLHSAAKLSLYVGSRHVCNVRLKLPGLDGSSLLYSAFFRHSQGPNSAVSTGAVNCFSAYMLDSKHGVCGCVGPTASMYRCLTAKSCVLPVLSCCSGQVCSSDHCSCAKCEEHCIMKLHYCIHRHCMASQIQYAMLAW